MRFWLFAGLVGCSEYTLDDEPGGPSDTGTVPVVTDLSEPVANAGGDRTAQPLDELVLDATASYDPEGREIVAVRWIEVSAPAGSRSDIRDADQATAAFFVDLAGTYVFKLTVQNDDGVWDSTPDQIVLTATPADGFYVELSWDAGNDLDLHLLNGTSGLFGSGDCSYCNRRPNWGEVTREDDPSLDRDSILGFGPETITIDAPGDGVFDIQVHYYGEGGHGWCKGACATSIATVNVYLAGVLEATFERSLSEQGELWDVATITWPSQEIALIDEMGHDNRITCP